jgi:hypothetical protein
MLGGLVGSKKSKSWKVGWKILLKHWSSTRNAWTGKAYVYLFLTYKIVISITIRISSISFSNITAIARITQQQGCPCTLHVCKQSHACCQAAIICTTMSMG